MKKLTKVGLQGGMCAGRWSCDHVGAKGCNTIPKDGENFINCEMYEPRVKEVKDCK